MAPHINNYIQNEDVLTEMTYDEIEEMKVKLKSEWPKTIYVYYFIENYLRWRTIAKNKVCIKFYRFTSSYAENNQFIAYLDDQNYIVTYNLDKNNNKPFEKLFKSKLINWKDGPTFGALQFEEREAIYEEIKKRDWEIEWDAPSHTFALSKEIVLQWDTELPEGVYLNTLKIEDAKRLNYNWAYKFDGSEKFFYDMIKYNGGKVLVDKSGNYIAWGLHNNYGAIGIIHVNPEFRRLGFGQLITKIIGKYIASKDMDVCAVTTDGNISEFMMRNIGLLEARQNTWIKIKSH